MFINPKSKQEEKALKLFDEQKYDEAALLFASSECYYECGYCKFLQGNFDSALKMWRLAKNDSPAINWGIAIVNLVENSIIDNVTYFDIRNFLERDISLLLRNNQHAFVEKLIQNSAVLGEVNHETYKYFARVLLNEGYVDMSFDFLIKAHNYCYKDPEVHHLLGRYYIIKNEIQQATAFLNKAIKINPNYLPIKLLLKEIEELNVD